MARITRLTESDINRIVKKVIKEGEGNSNKESIQKDIDYLYDIFSHTPNLSSKDLEELYGEVMEFIDELAMMDDLSEEEHHEYVEDLVTLLDSIEDKMRHVENGEEENDEM